MSEENFRAKALIGSASGLVGTALMFYGTRTWARYADVPRAVLDEETALKRGRSVGPSSSRSASRDPKPHREVSQPDCRRSASTIAFRTSRGSSKTGPSTVEPSPIRPDEEARPAAAASSTTPFVVEPVGEQTSKKVCDDACQTTTPVSILKRPSTGPKSGLNAAPLLPPPITKEVEDEIISFCDRDDFFWSAYCRAAAEDTRLAALSGLVVSLIVDEEGFQRQAIESEALRWYIDGDGYKVHSGMVLRRIESLRQQRRIKDDEELFRKRMEELASQGLALDSKKAELDAVMTKLLQEHQDSLAWLHTLDATRREDQTRLIRATHEAVGSLDSVQLFLQMWQTMSFEREEESLRATIEHEALTLRLEVRAAFQSNQLRLQRAQYQIDHLHFLEHERAKADEKAAKFEETRQAFAKMEKEKLAKLDHMMERCEANDQARARAVMEALKTAADHEGSFVANASSLFSEWREHLAAAATRDESERSERAEAKEEEVRRHKELEGRMAESLEVIYSLRAELAILRTQREEEAVARKVEMELRASQPPPRPASAAVSPLVDVSIQSGERDPPNSESPASTRSAPQEPFRVFQLQGPPVPDGWVSHPPTYFMRGPKCLGEALVTTAIPDVSIVLFAEELGDADLMPTTEVFAGERVRLMKESDPKANIVVHNQGPAVSLLERTDFEWRVNFSTGGGTSASRMNTALFAIFERVGYHVTLLSPTARFEDALPSFAAFMMAVRLVTNARRSNRGHGRLTAVRYAFQSDLNHISIDVPLEWRPLTAHNDLPLHFATSLTASPQDNVTLVPDLTTGKVRLSSRNALPMEVARRVIGSSKMREAQAIAPRMFLHHSFQFPLPEMNDSLIYEHMIGDFEVSVVIALTSEEGDNNNKQTFKSNFSDNAPRALLRVAVVESPESDLVSSLLSRVGKRNTELLKYLAKHNATDSAFIDAGWMRRGDGKLMETTMILYAVERSPSRWLLFYVEVPSQPYLKVIAQFLSKAASGCELFTPYTTKDSGNPLFESPARYRSTHLSPLPNGHQ